MLATLDNIAEQLFENDADDAVMSACGSAEQAGQGVRIR